MTESEAYASVLSKLKAIDASKWTPFILEGVYWLEHEDGEFAWVNDDPHDHRAIAWEDIAAHIERAAWRCWEAWCDQSDTHVAFSFNEGRWIGFMLCTESGYSFGYTVHAESAIHALDAALTYLMETPQ